MTSNFYDYKRCHIKIEGGKFYVSEKLSGPWEECPSLDDAKAKVNSLPSSADWPSDMPDVLIPGMPHIVGLKAAIKFEERDLAK